MAWRFKASKYKNAAPIVPKLETCIRDICVGSYQTYGNNIAASAAFMAFNWEHAGSSLAVLPIDDCGRKSKTMPLLHAHTDTITDLDFSPFHDGLLATASQDCLVKVWHIPEKGLETSISDAECTFSHKQRRVETVGFHPTADCLLYSTSSGCINLWDIIVQKEAFSNNEHPEVIQSVCWKHDGTILATSCKDKIVRILDPRSTSPISMSAESHQSIKDSRVVWLGDQNRILTTGFDSSRLRQVIIRDVRNFDKIEKALELDCSTGILMPLYDPDTNMLFLAGKGDITISYLEVTDRDPYFIEGLRHTGEQTKGACLVPKRSLRVMDGEVNRVLQLTSNTVIPIMYQVPRKTYRDFHSDLYPDTNGYKTELTSTEWLNGSNIPVPQMSLDPAKRELGDQPIIIQRGNLTELIKNLANKTIKKTVTPSAIHENVEITNFVPIKDKIKQMEQQNNKHSYEPEKCELELKFSEIVKESNLNEDELNESKETSLVDLLEECSTGSNGSNGSSNGSSEINGKHQNGSVTVPPKPLPRTSRTNSVSDQGQEEINNGVNGSIPRPAPRPRTTAGSYKPRLGPKPFSSSGASGDFSFDKVFSVPQVPGTENGENKENDEVVVDEEEQIEDEKMELTSPESNGSFEQKSEEIVPELKVVIEQNGSGDIVVDEIEGVPKTPSTAERRKMSDENEKIFESCQSESDDTFDNGTDPNFDRTAAHRSSIAERRRIYESRSQSVQDEKPASPTPLRRRDSLKQRGEAKEDDEKRTSNPPPANDVFKKPNEIQKKDDVTDNGKRNSSIQAPKRTSTVFGRVSKFRHLKGTTGHKSTHIENIRNIGRQLPGECDGFQANYERIAVPLSGPGGKIAVFELSKPGRLPDGVIPSLVNGSNIMDFQWDPFNPKRLAVACDDGLVKLWTIPDDGLAEPTNTPESELTAHLDKIYFIRFHPLAKNVLLTASYDMTIKVWDLETKMEKICLNGHSDQIFSFAWSPCGIYGASVSKDGKIRVYDPRKSDRPIREGNGPVGTRGARITWAIDGNFIVVTGFDKVSERQISVYKATDLSSPLNTVGLDVSPAILIPFYDEDSSTILATGKGDSTIYAFEITDESPFICPLSHHKCMSSHQGLSFLPKNQCDVVIVEFAKSLRLTNNTVEPLSFTVPRIKSELFQDDLFPPTRVTWSSNLSSTEWFAGKDKNPGLLNLQPEGMECLTATQTISTPTPVKKNEMSIVTQPQNRWNPDITGFVKNKQDEIQKSVSARMEMNLKLEQDSMEGVDENEWNE